MYRKYDTPEIAIFWLMNGLNLNEVVPSWPYRPLAHPTVRFPKKEPSIRRCWGDSCSLQRVLPAPRTACQRFALISIMSRNFCSPHRVCTAVRSTFSTNSAHMGGPKASAPCMRSVSRACPYKGHNPCLASSISSFVAGALFSNVRALSMAEEKAAILGACACSGQAHSAALRRDAFFLQNICI